VNKKQKENQHVSKFNVSINRLMNGNYGKCKWKTCDTCKENGDDDA